MQKIKFEIEIEAPANLVYRSMLGLDEIQHYEHWTAMFNPTSTYEGNWEKGSKIYFVGTSPEGERGGMVSEIAEHIPSQFVSIRHIGILQGEKEVTDGPDVEQWAGMLENYSFNEENGVTTVTVETDMDQDYLDYFNETWPKALEALKSLVLSL